MPSNGPELADQVLDVARDGASRVRSSKTATIIVLIIVLVLAAGAWDTFSNWGKAYGNVTINGLDVSGMNEAEMREALEAKFGARATNNKVVIYASEEAAASPEEHLVDEETRATSEQISAEEADAAVTSWTTDVYELKGSIPYDTAIRSALDIGRADGGIPGRFGLFFTGRNVTFDMVFDDASVDALGTTLDKTVGTERVDATVSIAEGVASPVAGHDGMMVDRAWLAKSVSDAMIGADEAGSFVAKAIEAPSRISMEQARSTSEAINRAIAQGASFTYGSTNWKASAQDIGSWTVVETTEGPEGYVIGASFDDSLAIPDVMAGAKTSTLTEGLTVTFENGEDGVMVYTSGTDEIPEVATAVDELEASLYGSEGRIHDSSEQSSPVEIEIKSSSAPESLSFEQALAMGIITPIGTYTTEFSNSEGTENRNHNIRVVSDILNNTIAKADGGEWAFNEHSGDTNLDPPFASAGSIVNGEYVDSIGGGICQVATTIFNAVYESGLDVVQRWNHALYISSYPTGRDASVSYPEQDFVWKNDLASDVLLKIDYTDTTVTATLYSVFTGYEVETEEGQWQEGAKYSTQFEYDSELGSGQYYRKTVGTDGSSISITRTVRDAQGTVISEKTFSTVYNPKNEVYVVGPGTDTSALVRTWTPSAY